MPISKTDFIRGLQCEKMLWLDAHAPERKIIPPEVQAKLDEGNEFGDTAMGIFGDYTEMTTLREDGRLDFSAMIEKTKTSLEEGLRAFDKKLPGFAMPEAVLSGAETRTSAPVRMPRGEDFCALGHPRIYPCGEGAGYAGGITSAATDGLKVAEAIIARYCV